MKKKTEVVTEGNRFSRREVTRAYGEFGPSEIWAIDYDEVLNVKKCLEKARAVLKSAGINWVLFHADSPHGSKLRDYVINFQSYAPDSPQGLAARIQEIALHIQSYEKLSGSEKLIPGLAYKLGRLHLLAQVYETTSKTAAKAAARPRPARKSQLRTKIISAFRAMRRNGLTLKEALESLETSGHRSLSISRNGKSYIAELDTHSGDKALKKSYGMKALEGMFSEAKTK